MASSLTNDDVELQRKFMSYRTSHVVKLADNQLQHMPDEVSKYVAMSERKRQLSEQVKRLDVELKSMEVATIQPLLRQVQNNEIQLQSIFPELFGNAGKLKLTESTIRVESLSRKIIEQKLCAFGIEFMKYTNQQALEWSVFLTDYVYKSLKTAQQWRVTRTQKLDPALAAAKREKARASAESKQRAVFLEQMQTLQSTALASLTPVAASTNDASDGASSIEVDDEQGYDETEIVDE